MIIKNIILLLFINTLLYTNNFKHFDKLTKYVNQANTKLPETRDSYIMEKIILDNNLIIKRFKLMNTTTGYQITKNSKQMAVKSMCNNKGMSFFIKNGLVLRFEHYSNNGYYLGSYEIYKGDCDKLNSSYYDKILKFLNGIF